MSDRKFPLAATSVVFVAAAATAVVGSTVSTVSAAPSSLQNQIDAQLTAHPGGVQTAPNEISYQGGKVTLTFPQPGHTSANPCAKGAYCFYDGANFTGRKLTFRDCDSTQFLTDYGFGDKTSSWTNATKHTIEVYDQNVQPWKLLWTQYAGAASVNVGSAADNKADFFNTTC
ncbi:peptidase inhibitor family I36 [Actinomadura pelletieri DSM 43383]|uniref:Peptidase inhibitor family I36 n=1 Tax=Actinomadura pelletieri DSM 43383 TaxID=1120940 RepID=A0A495Q9W9_9ACTN|nr:peptidase inhibitor family I36 protein [Actinomadura pelletieri]RKS68290.1 peptidase inhibitor family I36 [Actinomadura pelletieri DSM 43383]